MTDKARKKIAFFTRGRTDVTLLFVVCFLMVFGIIMVYSSSYHHSLETFGYNNYFFIRQTIWVVIGTFIMYAVSRINFRYFVRFSLFFYVIVLVLLVLVLFQPEVNGSKRWLTLLPGLRFQPSELAKVGLILTYAYLLKGFQKHLGRMKVFVPILLVGLIPIALVGKENLSTAIILMAIIGAMLFVIYPNVIRLIVMVVPPVVLGFYLFITQFSYRSDRWVIWREGPFSDPTGLGYQTIQSLYAIGSGGLFGVGLGKSIQKIDFIPEAHNDIIFSIICEELGLFGAFSILMLFLLLMWRLFDLIRMTSDIEGLLITVGVMAHIGVQLVINVGVVTNSIPATGIPLPLVSFGGSSLVFLLIEIGIVLNIARQTYQKIEGGGNHG